MDAAKLLVIGPGVDPVVDVAQAFALVGQGKRPLARLWARARYWLLLAWFAGVAAAAEVMPPAPRDHFNDYAGAVPIATRQHLNALLVQHERATSDQIVVAVFPRMLSEDPIESYTLRVANVWGVGRSGRSNGAVLFAFMQDRTLYLQIGYGLQGAVPDATAKRIIDDEIVPRFRAGDVDGGFRAGVTSLLAATRGEYAGTGRNAAEPEWLHYLKQIKARDWFFIVAGVVAAFFRRGDTVYTSRGHRSSGGWGGGSFSGGGGSFGGGGAGGRW